MNTEDQVFPYIGLRANFFSTLDAGQSLACSIQNPIMMMIVQVVINNLNSREAFGSINQNISDMS
jgi:hypothetical protein